MRTTALLCASLFATSAWADEAAPFVTELRLAARDASVEAFAWRAGDAVLVSRADLEQLSIRVPEAAGVRVSLADVPGLTFALNESTASIDLSCTTACFDAQLLDTRRDAPPLERQARGAYINYDVETRWLDAEGVEASGLAQAAAFGPWGLVESSWVGATGGDARGLARLETRWTIDYPARRLRMRLGDSVAIGASGAPVRFGGFQIGRHFGLEPSLITHPTLLLSGDAETASTVELYVDGALRARENVEAGPFVFENAPVVSGPGEAQLVVTDIAGRQQIITRSFFVSTALLRPGLSDWTFSAGAERQDFGRDSMSYERSFVSGRYRIGLTNALTLDTAADIDEDGATVQLGGTAAHMDFGQISFARAQSEHGGAIEASWLQQMEHWSLGVQAETRDADFRAVGLSDNPLRRSLAVSFSANLGNFGSTSFVAASVDHDGEPDAQTYALAYTPDFEFGSLTARLMYSESERSELAFGVSFSLALADDVSTHFAYDLDDRGAAYRASAQRAPETFGDAGWSARGAFGRYERVDLAAMLRGRFGDTTIQFVRSQDITGVRLQHAGSIGVIDHYSFAARPIQGAFALVDAGAPDVGVLRDRLPVGETGGDGLVVATDLRPYDTNAIAIAADDLPLDRAPSVTLIRTAPAEGAGVIVRFTDAAAPIRETRVVFANGEAAPRGATLVRQRDGARFPVGTNGRVVLSGTEDDDRLVLDANSACIADATAATLTLVCAATS